MSGAEQEGSIVDPKGPSREPVSIEFAGRRMSVATLLKAAALLSLLLVPFAGSYTFFLINQALLLAIFALGVDLIWGITGVMTFGHAAFFGLGAYLMTGILKGVEFGGAEIYAGLLVATAIPAIVGLAMAGVLFYQDIGAFRFTIITLALAIIAEQTAISWRDVTGGYDGIIGIPSFELGIPFVEMVPLQGRLFYFFSLLTLLAVYWFTKRTVNSPFGAALIAISENEEKARALGYNTPLYKTLVFGLGSAMAGFAGALFAPFTGFVAPSLLGFILSTNVLLWILIGGRGTVVGAIVGAVFLTVVENLLSGAFAFTWSLFLGIGLVLVVLVFPGGIMGLLDAAERRMRGR